MKTLILGGTGMLGHKLYQSLSDPIDAWVTVRGEARSVSRYGFFCPDRVIGNIDATNLDSIRNIVATLKPQVVINCIGIVKQQPLGNDPVACISINALLPHQIAELCAEFGARLIHISTDCVFDGTRGAYTEQDTTNALDLYGRSKALGETSASNALTLRTSIIGRELSTQFGLVEWFLAQRGTTAKGFTHALFSGFTTHELSRVIQSVILEHPELNGIYQVSSDPIDKYSLLNLMNGSFGANVEIEPSDELRIDRTLDSTRFRTKTGYCPPSWSEMVEEMASDITPYDLWRVNP